VLKVKYSVCAFTVVIVFLSPLSTVSNTLKKNPHPHASTSPLETSNSKDEKTSAWPHRCYLSADDASQHSDMPACGAAKAALVQSLPDTRTLKPQSSLLLQRATATASHYVHFG
jgi:hypothetical protein